MIIKNASFIKSSSNYKQCPEGNLPEYAFIGRSNVGKSSLINMLTQRNKLALTGNTPGKTILINHFLINNDWYLVDLPGYGFAQRGKKQREAFRELITSYVLKREQLTNLFVLVDSRIPPQAIDLEFMEEMGENGVPFSIVFTKVDKLSNLKLNEHITTYKQKLLEVWEELPPIFLASSVKGTGRDEILSYIETINKHIAS